MGEISSVLVVSACAALLACQVTAKPMKVFILAGQSNMTGIVDARTLAHIQMFPDTAAEFAAMFDADGNPVILDDVQVSQWRGKESGPLAPRYGGGRTGSQLGPDYAFGIYMHEALQEPFLIIKTSQGNRSLHACFRSPSAGEWKPPPGHPDLEVQEAVEGGLEQGSQETEAMQKEASESEAQGGVFYRKMISHVKDVLGDIKSVHPAYDEKAGYELAGFVWFQGWSDKVAKEVYPNQDKPRGYEQYTWLLEHFIRDVRNDLDAPDMPFLIGVMGIDGISTDDDFSMMHFRQAMAAPASNPEFKGTVAAMQTAPYWDDDLAALAARSGQVRRQRRVLQRQQGLRGEELEQAYAAYRAEHFTPEEDELLRNAVSDGRVHYLGSAKIMCGIGKGFAEAMLELMNTGMRDER